MDSRQLLVHEIQAPLTSLELQLRKLIDDHPEDDRLELCLQEIRELRSLVSNFLGLATRVENDTMRLGPVLDRIEKRFRPIAEAEQVRLEIELVEVSALGDARATERILSNLVDNAIKFSRDDDGHVRVRVSRTDGATEIEVSDDGIGIAPESQELVFEPFFRVDKERPGSGLGLALSHRLAEAQNGSLRLESKPGRGSSFILTLRST